MISSGRTRFVAQTQLAVSTVDAYGRRSATYLEGDPLRVDVREGMPSEQPYVDGVAVIANYELRTRWPNIARVGINPLSRIIVRGKTLRITGIRNLDQANRVAIIDCVEVA